MTLVPSPSAMQSRSETALFAQRRAAIDLLATSRARAIRSALFGAFIFRPHPTHPEDAETRARWRSILREQYDALARSSALAQGKDPQGVLPQEICAWIGAQGAAMPTHAQAFETMRALTHDVLLAAEAEDDKALDTALQAHFTFGRGGFFEKVSEFCDSLWTALDTARDDEVQKASNAGAAIAKTLTRLEHIGKHVRLVSLNASVEAARVGDAGRGLGVIAVEFKTLAEEIQHLAMTARADIADMAQNSGDLAGGTEKN